MMDGVWVISSLLFAITYNATKIILCICQFTFEECNFRADSEEKVGWVGPLKEGLALGKGLAQWLAQRVRRLECGLPHCTSFGLYHGCPCLLSL